MSIDYKDNGNAILAYSDEKHVATIIPQGDKYGYTVFNTPHMGAVASEEDARNAVERALAD
ncbi:MAG TPA: hypothetical protein VFI91_08040 [Longimicrobiaceae bacterium]|nr:hypothetical protein [Longimicrobiaceae bacterium]